MSFERALLYRAAKRIFVPNIDLSNRKHILDNRLFCFAIAKTAY